MNINEAKAEVLRAGNELVAKGLVARTWGNASCRIDEDHFAITPSGMAYDQLTEDDIVVVDLITEAYEGKRKPSSEKGIHRAAYLSSPEIHFVIHTHQAYASAMSITGYKGTTLTTEEEETLGGKIHCAAYGLPGTKKLKRNVELMLNGKNSAILMERHGALLTGAGREEAFQRAVLLEDICKRSMPYVSNCEKTIYSKRIPGGFVLTQNGIESTFKGKENSNDTVAMLHLAIYTAYPAFHYIAHLSSTSITATMENARLMPAMLDDFAQMVGIDVKIERTPYTKLTKAVIQSVIHKLSNRNCVCIEGLGAVCCAGDETDCIALMAIIEKNALACVHAGKLGKVKPLSFFDRTLMRYIYTHKYAKIKEQ
jgi:L-fuculose-phosphate aldolase